MAEDERMSEERWQELANACAGRGGDPYLKEALDEIRRSHEELDLLRKQEDSNFQKFYEVREALRELVDNAEADKYAGVRLTRLDDAIERARDVLASKPTA